MAEDDDFDAPAPKIRITDYEGKLLLITAHEIIKDIPSDFSKNGSGMADATAVTFAVIDDDGTGSGSEMEAWIFQGGIQGQLRARIGSGKKTLARLQKGASKKGDFQWILADPTEADRAAARKFLKKTDNPPF